jgi:hypothetical protein
MIKPINKACGPYFSRRLFARKETEEMRSVGKT